MKTDQPKYWLRDPRQQSRVKTELIRKGMREERGNRREADVVGIASIPTRRS